MIDLFRQLKLEYKEYVILIKSGSFYVCFDEDAIVMNSIFNFKINELKNNIKIGFPINSLSKNIKELKNIGINFIIVDNYEIKDEFKSNNNMFKKYCDKSVFEVISLNNKINKIVEKIKSIDDINEKKIIIDKIYKLVK